MEPGISRRVETRSSVEGGAPVQTGSPLRTRGTEAGVRVTTTSLVRDLDLPVPEAADNRRLEMWSRMGCPFFGGSTIGVGHDAGVRLAL